MDEHCKELMEKLSGFLDGEVGGREVEEILEHLEECECCKHCYETLKATREMVRTMPAPEMPQDLKDRLKACLKK